MIHGGDIYRNKVELDFSINVNPLGMPERVRQALVEAVNACTKYPDIEAQRLTEAVQDMLGIPENSILFGNGASELFQVVMHTLRPNKIWMPVPSFYGYEHAAKGGDCEVCCFPMGEEQRFTLDETVTGAIPEDTDLIFLANPNNPTGMLLSRKVLEEILVYCRDRNIYVVLDECFIEFCEAADSMLPEIGLSVDMRKIAVRQETIEVCECFHLNPYQLTSTGCILVVTTGGEELVEQLCAENLPAAVIGYTTDRVERVLMNGGEKRYLDRPAQDELMKFFSNCMRKTDE